MSFSARLLHSLVIERGTPGTENPDTGHAPYTYATLAAVKGLVQPKRATEVAALHQAGAVVSDHTIFLLPTDITEGDRVRFAVDDGRRYEIRGVRDAAGIGHHLEVDARLVQ